MNTRHQHYLAWIMEPNFHRTTSHSKLVGNGVHVRRKRYSCLSSWGLTRIMAGVPKSCFAVSNPMSLRRWLVSVAMHAPWYETERGKVLIPAPMHEPLSAGILVPTNPQHGKVRPSPDVGLLRTRIVDMVKRCRPNAAPFAQRGICVPQRLWRFC
jgi:hypothetical protein